jgi:hypothetical protein
MIDTLHIIFSMLLANSLCDYTDEFHYMVLPNSKLSSYEIYHPYESSQYLYLTKHSNLQADSLHHQYEFFYPRFDNNRITTQYCMVDSIWEQVYYPEKTEHPYYEE